MSKAIECFKDMIRTSGKIPTLEDFMETTGYKRDSYYRAKRDYLKNGLDRIIDKEPYVNQTWKTIPDYEDYLISDCGVVYNIKSNRLCKISPNQYGYFAVCLLKDGVLHSKLLHQLLGIAFIPNPENKTTIDHINRIISDNRLENLRWATPKEQSENQSRNIIVKDEITGKEYPTFKSFKKENSKVNSICVYCVENDKVYENWKELAQELFPDKKIKTVSTGVHRAIAENRPYCGYRFQKAHKYTKTKREATSLKITE